MSYIISIDAGTSSLRSVLFDEYGNRLFMAQEKYSPIFPSDGYVEQDPYVWKKALYSTLTKTAVYAKQNAITISAISLTSQRSSVFAVNKQNEPLCNAMMWHDKRSISICERLYEKESLVYSKTGLRMDPMFSAPKMAWIKENNSELYDKAYKLVGVHEYLLCSLCGKFITDYSLGSRTMLMNLKTLNWDDEVLRIFGIDCEKLCTLVEQGSVCGTLRPEVAGACGLNAGIIIVSAGGDQQCGALGLGIMHPGQVEVTTGTGAFVVGISNHPVIDSRMRFICNVAASPGYYILEAPILTAGNVYQWFARTFIDEKENFSCMQQANELVMKAPPGANGLIMFPYFKGRGAPSWNSNIKGAVLNLTLETSKSDFARAIIEGIALEITENIKLISTCFCGEIDEILVSGGLTKLQIYNQIISDVSGLKVKAADNNEATALGAWISAAVAIGMKTSLNEAFKTILKNNKYIIFTPDKINTERYIEILKTREQIYFDLYEKKK